MVEDGEERGQEETKEKKRARVDVRHTRVLSQQHASYHRPKVFENTSITMVCQQQGAEMSTSCTSCIIMSISTLQMLCGVRLIIVRV
jgi:hypothetical protein